MYLEQGSEKTFRTGNIARDLVHGSDFPIFVFLIAHIPLALLMRQAAEIATLHVIATLGVGLLWAWFDRRSERTAYIIAYITGAEVLWRMTDARVFWEFGKYAVVLIAVVAMLRRHRFGGAFLPLFYFALLLPSVRLTLSDLDLGDARESISFNLSGPFALLICTWFFSQFEFSLMQFQRLLIALIVPVVGVVAVAISSTLTARAITFTTSSNFTASGGFGPNQVSSILGLGVVFAFFYLMCGRGSRVIRALVFVAMIVFAVQGILTFSRGGMLTALGAIMLGAPFLLSDRRSRFKFFLLTVLFVSVANYVLLPRLEAFTGGALQTRYTETDVSDRDLLVRGDIQLWQENFIFGVGPGMAKFERQFSMPVAAHTEFSRMLAEHGVLGLLALVCMLAIGFQSLKQARTARERAIAVALLVWAFVSMLHAAMRLVAPAFAFGLTAARIVEDELPEESPIARNLPFTDTTLSTFSDRADAEARRHGYLS